MFFAPLSVLFRYRGIDTGDQFGHFISLRNIIKNHRGHKGHREKSMRENEALTANQ
jgi:hypothetical protein